MILASLFFFVFLSWRENRFNVDCKTIYISSACLISCNGTRSFPYANLFAALDAESSQWLNPEDELELVIEGDVSLTTRELPADMAGKDYIFFQKFERVLMRSEKKSVFRCELEGFQFLINTYFEMRNFVIDFPIQQRLEAFFLFSENSAKAGPQRLQIENCSFRLLKEGGFLIHFTNSKLVVIKLITVDFAEISPGLGLLKGTNPSSVELREVIINQMSAYSPGKPFLLMTQTNITVERMRVNSFRGAFANLSQSNISIRESNFSNVKAVNNYFLLLSGEENSPCRLNLKEVLFSSFWLHQQQESEELVPGSREVLLITLEHVNFDIEASSFSNFTMISEEFFKRTALIQANNSRGVMRNTSFLFIIGVGVGAPGIIICKSSNTLNMTFLNFSFVKMKIAMPNLEIDDLVKDNFNKSDVSRDILTNLFSLDTDNTLSISNIFVNEILSTYAALINAKKNNKIKLNSLTSQKVITEYFGGCFMLAFNNSLILSKANLSKIYAFVGGLIFMMQNNSFVANMSTTNEVTVRPNLALNQFNALGGIIYARQSNYIFIQYSEFSFSFSTKHGGAFYLMQDNIFNVICANLTNSSSFGAGGMLFSSTKNSIFFKNTTISYSSSDNGGVFYLDFASNLTVLNSVIYLATANNGGVVHSLYKNSICFLSTIFHYNSAISRGGTFYLVGSPKNGSIFFIKSASFFLTDNKFEGALFYLAKENYLMSVDIESELCFSNDGSFLLSDQSNTISLKNIKMHNHINLQGAAINLSDSNVILLQELYITSIYSFKSSFLIAKRNNSLYLKNSSFNDIYSEQVFLILTGNYFSAFFLKISGVSNILSSSFQNYVTIDRLLLLQSTNISFVCQESNRIIILDSKLNIGEAQPFLFANISNTVAILQVDFLLGERLEKTVSLLDFSSGNIIFINGSLFKRASPLVEYFKGIIFVCENNTISVNRARFELLENFGYIFLLGKFNLLTVNSTLFGHLFKIDKVIWSLEESVVRIKNVCFKNLSRVNAFFLVSQSNLSMADAIFYLNETEAIIISLDSKIIISNTEIREKESSRKLKTKNNLFRFMKNSSAIFQKSSLTLVVSVVSPFNFENSTIRISLSTFIMNRVFGGAGGLFHIQQNSSFFINMSFLLANSAKFGAVFFISEARLIIIYRCKFKFNKATRRLLHFSINNAQLPKLGVESRGGVFYMNNKSLVCFSMGENQFKANTADIGGIFFFAYERSQSQCHSQYGLQKSKEKNEFIRNAATLYGNYEGGNISWLNLTSSQISQINSTTIILSDPLISNRNVSDCLFYVVPVDRSGQFAKNIEEFDIKLNKFKFNTSASSYIIIEILYRKINGSLCITGFRDINQTFMRSDVNLTLSYSDFKGIYPSHNNSKNLSILFSFRFCEFGEYYDLDRESCTPCPAGYFSFNRKVSEFDLCLRCENQPFFCYGGVNITPKPGYWRLNDSSDKFFLCPNRKACRGDVVGINPNIAVNENVYNPTLASGSCDSGYTGALCSKCSKEYGLSQPFVCTSCNSPVNYFSYIVKLIIRIFIFCYSVWKGVHLTQNLKFKQYEPNADEGKAWNLAGTNSLIKIFLNHSHILYSLMNFPFDWPDIFNDIFSISFGIFSPDTGEALSFECILKKMKISLPLIYFQLLAILIIPIIIAMLVVVYFTYKTLRRKRQIKQILKEQNNPIASMRPQNFNLISAEKKSKIFRNSAFSLIF